MSPFEAELGLDEIWPVWSRETRLVVTLYDLVPLIMRERYNAEGTEELVPDETDRRAAAAVNVFPPGDTSGA